MGHFLLFVVVVNNVCDRKLYSLSQRPIPYHQEILLSINDFIQIASVFSCLLLDTIMFRWKRPHIDGFPQVYMRFKARDTETDELVEYRIQDLPEDRFEEAANFMIHDQYLREEPFAKGSGLGCSFLLDGVVSFYDFRCEGQSWSSARVSWIV